jgi:hypothetical protein
MNARVVAWRRHARFGARRRTANDSEQFGIMFFRLDQNEILILVQPEVSFMQVGKEIVPASA